MGPRPRKLIFTPRYWLEACRGARFALSSPALELFPPDAAEAADATDEDDEEEEEEVDAFVGLAAAALVVDVEPLVLPLGNGLDLGNGPALGLFGVTLTALTGDASAVAATLACFGGRPAFF